MTTSCNDATATAVGDVADPTARVPSPRCSVMRILYVFSTSARPTTSLHRALALSRKLNAELHVLCVLPEPLHLRGLLPELHTLELVHVVNLSRTADALTREWLRDVLCNRLPPERLQVRHGTLIETVAAHVAELGAHLIVMPPGPGHCGSITTRLACLADVPVLVARSATNQSTIVAATDLKNPDYPVLRRAAELGATLDANLVAIHNVRPYPVVASPGGVWPLAVLPGDEVEPYADRLACASQSLQVDAEAVVAREPSAADAILFEARCRDADLIVVGTRAHSWFDRMLVGSVAEQIVDRALRSVLVTPIDGAPSLGLAPVGQA